MANRPTANAAKNVGFGLGGVGGEKFVHVALRLVADVFIVIT